MAEDRIMYVARIAVLLYGDVMMKTLLRKMPSKHGTGGQAMRDYEELVERLRDSADWADHFAVLMGRDSDVSSEIKREAADAIEDLIAALTASNTVIANSKPKWISVENELPKNELRTYWVYTSVGSQHSCRWTNNRFGLGVSDKWGWSVFDIPQYTVVTHWMPLPEPPKEDDK